MATVTGLTKERMEAIEAASVVDGEIDEFGHLILTRFDTTTIDAGPVLGSVPDASDTVKGIVELATEAETVAGVDTLKAVTPATLLSALGLRVPTGVILMWPTNTPPSGWVLCDGTERSRSEPLFSLLGTTFGVGDGSTTYNLPNFKGRVPVGVDVTQSEFNTIGETGGAKTHTLIESEMPSHTHTGPSHTHTGPSHTHTGPSHTHGVGTLATGSNGSHTHPTGSPGWVGGAQDTNVAFGSGNWHTDQPTFSAGSHTHSLSGSTASGGTGNTGSAGTGSTGSAGTGATGSAGSDGAHNNLQPYISMNYIIKL